MRRTHSRVERGRATRAAAARSARTGGAGGTIGAHPLAWFVALSYAISWLVWLPLILDPRRALPSSRWWPLHFVGAMGPLVAALVVAGASEGWSGLRILLDRFRPRARQARWLVLALLLPYALWAIAAALALVVFNAPMPGVARLAEWPKLPGLGLAAAWLYVFVTNAVGEEGGWRGFALPRLQLRHAPFTATVMLTAMWAGWHLPLFFHDPSFAAMSAGEVVGWAVSLFAGAVVLTWLFNASRGSALAAALFHNGVNLVWMSRAADGAVGPLLGACTIVLALGVSPWLWRSRPAR